MSSWKSLIIGTALVLGTAGALGAAQSSTKSTTATKEATKSTETAKPMVHHEMGTVDSVNSSDLVLSHTYKGKEENTTFKLDPSTKKEGMIDKGTRVEVYYKNENHEHVATEVKAEPKKS